MSIKQSRGAAGESLAAAYLELAGYAIEKRNTRIAGVEIDLVARDGEAIVLVEVKYRGRRDFGGAAGAIDHVKRRRLMRAANTLVQGGRPVRIDVVAIDLDEHGATVKHFINAVTC